MVKIFSFLLKNSSKLRGGQFIDALRLRVSGGHGGNGDPRTGGQGGQGGCVYVTAKEEMTLKKVSHQFSSKRAMAGDGEESSKMRILGRRGADVEICVPQGISVIDEETGKCLGDLNEVGHRCLAAGGGSGGCSGNSFIGKRGHRRMIKLDLKLIADVGLVGFPNAGKSTFLNAISNASPKIAAYPFTTIKPQIGIIDYSDHRQVSVADLPGLIEGAHRNIGMGHKFLKHVERTRMLLLIVDVFGFQLSPNHKKRNLLENIFSLNKELELYDPSLLTKNCVLLINKMDVAESDAELAKFKDALDNLDKVVHHCSADIKPDQLLKFERILTISAKRGDSVEQAKLEIRNVLDLEAERNLAPTDVGSLGSKLAERSSRLV